MVNLTSSNSNNKEEAKFLDNVRVEQVDETETESIFINKYTKRQLALLQELTFVKENVPCVDYLLGFCQDGDSECVYWHPKNQ